MNSELFYGAAPANAWSLARVVVLSNLDIPESITCCDEDAETILNKPEADFGEVSTFANAVDPNEGDAVRNPLLGGGYRRGQLCPN